MWKEEGKGFFFFIMEWLRKGKVFFLQIHYGGKGLVESGYFQNTRHSWV
jgi:hypothetical protein